MPDDPIDRGLRAYSDDIQRTATLPAAGDVRHRATRRRQRRLAGTAFAAVLVAVVGVGLTVERSRPTPTTPAGPSSSAPRPSSATTTRPSSPTPTVTSDVSQLREIGIDLNVPVLIDVADDGVDRFLEAKPDGVVDFTGTAKTATTSMMLRPASITGLNRVVLVATSGGADGSEVCVVDTPGTALEAQACRPGDRAQAWRVGLAGDSGQFVLEGPYGIVHVADGGLITTVENDRDGLQTLPFAK